MKLISGERYLVDTNVLAYSIDKESRFYLWSRRTIEEGFQQGVRFVVAQQNLIELIAVLTRGYGISLKEAFKDVQAFASRFELICPLATTFETYLGLANKARKAYPFDAYLVATMKDSGVERLITGNSKDFQGVGLREIIGIKINEVPR